MLKEERKAINIENLCNSSISLRSPQSEPIFGSFDLGCCPLVLPMLCGVKLVASCIFWLFFVNKDFFTHKNLKKKKNSSYEKLELQ